PLIALLLFVRDLLALGQRLVALALNLTEVDKQILAAVIRRDEPIALLAVEPLDSSSCHPSLTSPPAHERAKEAEPERHQLLARTNRDSTLRRGDQFRLVVIPVRSRRPPEPSDSSFVGRPAAQVPTSSCSRTQPGVVRPETEPTSTASITLIRASV